MQVGTQMSVSYLEVTNIENKAFEHLMFYIV